MLVLEGIGGKVIYHPGLAVSPLTCGVLSLGRPPQCIVR